MTALNGIRRSLAKPRKRMSPITPGILQHLIQFPRIHDDTPKSVAVTLEIIRCLYIVLFYSMVRISSLVPNSTGSFDRKRQLTWDNIKMFPDGAVIELVLTKTIQNCNRTHQIALAASPESPFCPVAALHRIANIRGERPPGDPVFAIPAMGGWAPLSRYQVDTVLTMQIEKAGLDPKLYKFHSFRRGAIQLAILLEPKLHLIRLQSDHSSTAFEAYTNLPAESRFSLTSMMINGTAAQANH